MAGQSLRNFSASARRHVLQLLGRVSLEDVVRNNGSSGETWAHSVKSVAEKVEDQYPAVTGYEIQGAKAHKSSKDPDDPDDVITLAFYTARGQRMLSGHVHENGTFKLAESRLGRKSKKK